MRRFIVATLAMLVLSACQGGEPVAAGLTNLSEVYGVQGEDMLKLRAGPGIGYRVIVGIPNGTVVRVYKCEQSGSTRWCQVALNEARGLKGYVSSAYLREN